MNYQIETPYDDDDMTFDEERGQYILTEHALMSRGIDLRAELAETATVTPESCIKTVTYLASDMIYGYLHGFSSDNNRQDYFIAKLVSLRKIIFEAMLYQAIYIRSVGNLFLSTDEKDRRAAIDETAKMWLAKTVPELGTSILYSGGL